MELLGDTGRVGGSFGPVDVFGSIAIELGRAVGGEFDIPVGAIDIVDADVRANLNVKRGRTKDGFFNLLTSARRVALGSVVVDVAVDAVDNDGTACGVSAEVATRYDGGGGGGGGSVEARDGAGAANGCSRDGRRGNAGNDGMWAAG